MLFLNYLFKFLKIKENSSIKDEKLVIPDKIKSIEFVNVCFRYLKTGNDVLKKINLKLIPDKKICLVGENGSGKSTIIKLLLRVYTPTSGKILMNGVDIEKYNLIDYRKLIGVAFQDYINYSVKVKDCIGFGDINRLNDIENIKLVAKQRQTILY